MIYEIAKVGGPVVYPLSLHVTVTDNIPPPHGNITDGEGVAGFASGVHRGIVEVRGVNNANDSYVLHADISDGQDPNHPVLSDGQYAYGAHPLSLFVWNDNTFTYQAVQDSLASGKVKTGHFVVDGNAHLTVVDSTPGNLEMINDPTPLSFQSTKRTGSTEWFNAELTVTDNRAFTSPHLVISDSDIITQEINTSYTTADLLDSGEKLQYWS